MLRRQWFLLSSSALLVLAGLIACSDEPENNGAKQPPPVVGTRTKKPTEASAPAMGMQAPAATAAGSGQLVMTAAPAANSSGVLAGRDAAAMEELDAGPAGRAAAAGSGGAFGRAAAGSGGTGGMRAAGSGGRGGTGGSGGQAGGQSDACAGQVCFTVFDCWLLSGADCSYSTCNNFTCK